MSASSINKTVNEKGALDTKENQKRKRPIKVHKTESSDLDESFLPTLPSEAKLVTSACLVIQDALLTQGGAKLVKINFKINNNSIALMLRCFSLKSFCNSKRYYTRLFFANYQLLNMEGWFVKFSAVRNLSAPWVMGLVDGLVEHDRQRNAPIAIVASNTVLIYKLELFTTSTNAAAVVAEIETTRVGYNRNGLELYWVPTKDAATWNLKDKTSVAGYRFNSKVSNKKNTDAREPAEIPTRKPTMELKEIQKQSARSAKKKTSYTNKRKLTTVHHPVAKKVKTRVDADDDAHKRSNRAWEGKDDEDNPDYGSDVLSESDDDHKNSKKEFTLYGYTPRPSKSRSVLSQQAHKIKTEEEFDAVGKQSDFPPPLEFPIGSPGISSLPSSSFSSMSSHFTLDLSSVDGSVKEEPTEMSIPFDSSAVYKAPPLLVAQSPFFDLDNLIDLSENN
jgi:hypothetical protein